MNSDLLSALAELTPDVPWMVAPYRLFLERGELLIGLGFKVPRADPKSLDMGVFLRPTYWPRGIEAFGIFEDLGVWGLSSSFYLPNASAAKTAAGRLSDFIYRDLIPMYERWEDERGVLRDRWLRPLNPLVGVCKYHMSATSGVFGFMSAKCGRMGDARRLLTDELSHVGRDSDYGREIGRTIAALRNPTELEALLNEFSSKTRGAMGPILSVDEYLSRKKT